MSCSDLKSVDFISQLIFLLQPYFCMCSVFFPLWLEDNTWGFRTDRFREGGGETN